jgi:osmotically-inducible protein OsmY
MREMRVTAQGGEVTLCGTVPSTYYKRRCAELCQHVAGVMHVCDQLEVTGRLQ